MITFLLVLFGVMAPSGHATMDGGRMLTIIQADCQDVVIRGHQTEFAFDGVQMMLIHDPRADRMRIISPIVSIDDLEPGQLESAMAANFHTALDARYAVSNGVVWAAFIHPLSSLRDDGLRSAIRQVASARATFGTTYTSGHLVFPGQPLVE